MRMLSIAATILLVSSSGSAMAASSQKDVSTCRAAVLEVAQGTFSDPFVKFKNIKGASKKSISFEVSDDQKSTVAVCTIKRGKVLSVDL